MARTKNDPLLQHFRGKLGNLVLKQYKDCIVITKCPDMSRVKRTKKQKERNGRFKKAVAYAKSILRDPEARAAYEKKLQGKRSVYHAAIAEFLEKDSESPSTGSGDVADASTMVTGD